MTAIRLRVPLAQYSYIEYDFEGTPEEAIDEVNTITKLYEIKQSDAPGLSEKDFRQVVDKYLMTEALNMEDIDNLNKAQKYWLDVTKRAMARIKSKEDTGYRADNINRIID